MHTMLTGRGGLRSIAALAIVTAASVLQAQPPSSRIERSSSSFTPSAATQPLPNGCYAFSFGQWMYADGWGGDPGAAMPSRLVLDTMPLRWRSRFRTLRPGRRVAADSAHLARSSWESIGPDSLGVAWTDGGAGVELRLAIDGDTLRGRAHVYPADSRDALKEPRATVLAVRVPCGASADAPDVGPRREVATTAADSAIAGREVLVQADRLHRGETLMAMERLNLAIRQFQHVAARLPRQLEELLTLKTERVQPTIDWVIDGWGHTISYLPGLSGYTLRSAGADGAQWTKDDIVVTKKPR